VKHVKESIALIFTITFHFFPTLIKHLYQAKGYKIKDIRFIKNAAISGVYTRTTEITQHLGQLYILH
jgi:hypothetical protein